MDGKRGRGGRNRGRGRGSWKSRGRGRGKINHGILNNVLGNDNRSNDNNNNAEQRIKKQQELDRQRILERINYTNDNNNDNNDKLKDDNDNTENILSKYLSNFNEDIDIMDLPTTARTKELIKANQEQNMSCLICIENIDIDQSVWNCNNCFTVFHLYCIRNWAESAKSNSKVTQMQELFPQMEINWHCPSCRNAYDSSNNIPNKYTCFCGKIENPPINKWLPPHSCGELCEKSLVGCDHICTLPCHPGACLPCPQMIDWKCYCGKEETKRRCIQRDFSCHQICNKILNCNEHRCEQECHEGLCDPCNKASIKSCQCGRVQEMKSCQIEEFSCGQKCGRPFSCGHHICEIVCHNHEDNMSECPLSGIRKCPCGKETYELSCEIEETPTCGATCEQQLECGKHLCQEMCHHNKCEPCRTLVEKYCMCGNKRKKVICSSQFKCNIQCQKLKNCQRHKCRAKCCTGCSPCDKICGKKLNCGIHRCEALCHAGNCLECPKSTTLTCACEATRITVRCGMEKFIDVPKCLMRCRKPSNCHHTLAESKPHTCHFGECPKCELICGRKPLNPDPLANCVHYCKLPCHDNVDDDDNVNQESKTNKSKIASPVSVWGPLPVVANKTNKQPKKKIKKKITKECPKCEAIVKRQCVGRHKYIKCKCSDSVKQYCNERCGAKLLCNNHTCERPCHDLSEPHQICDRPCSIARPEGCIHKCDEICHPDKCKPCEKDIKLFCNCGQLPTIVKCFEYLNWTMEKKTSIMSCNEPCHKPLKFCNHLCPEICHIGECPNPEKCEKTVTVRCRCGGNTEEWICSKAQKEKLVQACTSLKLLPCNSVICRKKEEEKRRRKEEKEEERRLDLLKAEEEEHLRQEVKLKKRQERSKLRYERRHQEDNEKETYFTRQKIIILILWSICITLFLILIYGILFT